MNLRDRDRASIHAYLLENSDLLTGRVLDFGAGRQPYRDVIEGAGGEYVPYDRTAFPGSCAEADSPDPVGVFDAVVVTQVVQYLLAPVEEFRWMRSLVRPGGWLDEGTGA